MPDKALILVDIQNDYCTGGAMAIQDGEQIVSLANRLMPHFPLVVATQDWHPANHGCFAVNHLGMKVGDAVELSRVRQILRPVHCVQATHGAAFVAGLHTQRIEKIFFKGTDPAIDSHSGFFDNEHRKPTGMDEFLKSEGVQDVYIVGLATDSCVKFTALDAVTLGFKAYVIEDVCRGMELKAGDIEWAIEEMKKAGVTILTSREILKQPVAEQAVSPIARYPMEHANSHHGHIGS